MPEIRTILCPVDFSDHSRRAFDQAVAIGRRHKSSLTVLYVVATASRATNAPGTAGFDSTIFTPADHERLLAELKTFIDAEAVSDVALQLLIRKGDVAAEILKQGIDMKAELLVLGTHGRSGFERFLLGSVTEKVVRRACCPVLTVPRHQPDAVPSSPPYYERILCPIDFSDCSMMALRYAVLLADENDAQLTLLHVTSDEIVRPGLFGSIIPDERETLADFRGRQTREALELLEDALSNVPTHCIVERVVAHGRPTREILRVAAERRTDLLVLGVYGRSAVDLAFFGSTTNAVVREAMCPVLTVRL